MMVEIIDDSLFVIIACIVTVVGSSPTGYDVSQIKINVTHMCQYAEEHELVGILELHIFKFKETPMHPHPFNIPYLRPQYKIIPS